MRYGLDGRGRSQEDEEKKMPREERRRKEKKREEKERKKKEKGLKEKEGTPFGRWKGVFAKLEKQKRVAAKTHGVGKEKHQGKP